ncbi:ABC transporter permease [Agrococcus sp. Marseille-P2731]|uniref:ABC transporter permease n=1 Tax=Agrococcus sp. Marseille-P2731 TaxID=1841862 RepID=UPI0009317567|nr:ABC transporter permease [Agrococcus sp. Marseille-P2731]
MTDVVAAVQDAWTELRIHRGRVLMSLIGVMLAITALTASVAIGELARSTILVSLEAQSGRAATITAYVSPAASSVEQPTSSDQEATLDAMEATVERYAIDYASPVASGDLPLVAQSGMRSVSIMAVAPDFAVMHHLETTEGRFLTESDRARLAPAVVVNRGVLDALGGGALAQHRTVEVGGTTAVIVGVVDRGQNDSWPQAWMLPRDLVRVADAAQGAVYMNPFQLELWVPEEAAVDGVRMVGHDLRTALPGSTVDVQRSDWQAWDSGFDPLLPLQLTLIGTATVILLLGALGLVTVAVVSIRQRVREFGIRRAFGASRGRVFVAVMLESVVGTVVAGAVGIAICIFAYRLPVVEDLLTQGLAGATLPGFPMGAAVVGLVVSAAVGAIAGSIPATIAVRSKVIEAIRF